MTKRKVKCKGVVEKMRQCKARGLRSGLLCRQGFKPLIILFLIVATFAVFEQVRNYAFLNFDDNIYVTENRNVQSGLTLKSVNWAFTTMHAANWHPLTWLCHMLDCQLYGLNPGGHHLTNLLFHIANTVLLFLVLERMTKGQWRSGFVAALFALHPLHVESVAWISERKDVLSTFFWMLTMWTYVRYIEQPRLNRYLLVLLFFALGLLSKPMLVTLPFVLLLLDYWPLGRLQPIPGNANSPSFDQMNPIDQRSRVLSLIREKVPFFALCAVSCILTIFAQHKGGAVTSLGIHPFESRIANALISYISYIEKLIWPSHLAAFYPYPKVLSTWKIVGSWLLLIGVSVLVIRVMRKLPYLGVGWFWYLGTLVPVIGLVQVGWQAMADRYTYVPLIGLFIVIGWGVPEISVRWHYRRIVVPISIGLLLSILIIVSRLQVQHWQNSIRLFEHSLNVTSNNYLSHNNLGIALYHEGRNLEAIVHYNEALRIDPDFYNAHYNLGIVLVGQGKTQEAISHLTEALRIKPNYAEAHNNLGNVFAQQGKYQEAIFHLIEALRIKPNYVEAHNNLGNVFAEQEKYLEAIAHFTEALRLKPDLVAVHYNLGIVYLKIGKQGLALEEYKILKTVNPDLATKLYQKIFK